MRDLSGPRTAICSVHLRELVALQWQLLPAERYERVRLGHADDVDDAVVSEVGGDAGDSARGNAGRPAAGRLHPAATERAVRARSGRCGGGS